MGRVLVAGASLAGLAAAARLARVGHDVTVADVDPTATLADVRAALDAAPLPFPAPWRDFFAKTGRPAKGALGRHGLDLVPDAGDWPGDRGAQWHLLVDRHGEAAAAAWRDLIDRHDDTWLALRPLGLEAEFTPEAARAAASALDPAHSVEDAARTLVWPDLAERVRGVARAVGTDPAAAPAWLLSRLAVERTFGLWQVADADGVGQPASRLVDLVWERAEDVGVRIVAHPDAASPDARVDATDPGATWRRPARGLFRRETFLDQWLSRPPLRDPSDPRRFHASPASPGGSEPWAQLLTGALAAYAVHEALTGEDIRPTNRAQSRH